MQKKYAYSTINKFIDWPSELFLPFVERNCFYGSNTKELIQCTVESRKQNYSVYKACFKLRRCVLELYASVASYACLQFLHRRLVLRTITAHGSTLPLVCVTFR